MMGSVLGSWVESPAKRAIVDFVSASSREGSSGFVPVAERIAAFDNDGTLWVERPAPVQIPFLLQKLIGRVELDPSLAEIEPYRSIINRDDAFFRAVADQEPEAVLSMLSGIGAAWEGTTPSEYESEVETYLASNHDERFGRPYTDLVYQPMLELFDFLRANDWRVFVCSGGGRDFMRVIAEDTWGLLRENVIGSAPEFEYRDGQLVRQNTVRGNVALGPGKPEHIFARTGRLPAFSAGNADVDIEMLEVARYGLVIVHDDAEREYDYTDGAERILPLAEDLGWTLVSMKNDWNTVFKEGI